MYTLICKLWVLSQICRIQWFAYILHFCLFFQIFCTFIRFICILQIFFSFFLNTSCIFFEYYLHIVYIFLHFLLFCNIFCINTIYYTNIFVCILCILFAFFCMLLTFYSPSKACLGPTLGQWLPLIGGHTVQAHTALCKCSLIFAIKSTLKH